MLLLVMDEVIVMPGAMMPVSVIESAGPLEVEMLRIGFDEVDVPIHHRFDGVKGD
jgi:hypothetical protein